MAGAAREATADRSRSTGFCKACCKAGCKPKPSGTSPNRTERTERQRQRRARKNERVSNPDAVVAREPERRGPAHELDAARRSGGARANRSDREADRGEGLGRSEEARRGCCCAKESRRPHEGGAKADAVEDASGSMAASDSPRSASLPRRLGIPRAPPPGPRKT